MAVAKASSPVSHAQWPVSLSLQNSERQLGGRDPRSSISTVCILFCLFCFHSSLTGLYEYSYRKKAITINYRIFFLFHWVRGRYARQVQTPEGVGEINK